MFGAVKPAINVDPDKCSYSRYGIEFNSRSLFSTLNSLGRKVIIFGVDNSSLVRTDDNKNILALDKSPTQGLDNTSIEDEYSTNSTVSRKWFALSLHYNGSNSFLFVNATKIYQFKSK